MSKEATTGAVETARPPRPPIAAPPIAATALQTPILARIPDVSPAQPPVATTDESPAPFDSAPERLPAKMPDEQTSHRPSAGAARPQLENPDPNEQPSGEKMPFALLHSDKYDNWPVSPKLLAVAGTVAAVLILAIVLRGGPSSSVPDEPKDDGAAPVIDPLAGAGAETLQPAPRWQPEGDRGSLPRTPPSPPNGSTPLFPPSTANRALAEPQFASPGTSAHPPQANSGAFQAMPSAVPPGGELHGFAQGSPGPAHPGTESAGPPTAGRPSVFAWRNAQQPHQFSVNPNGGNADQPAPKTVFPERVAPPGGETSSGQGDRWGHIPSAGSAPRQSPVLNAADDRQSMHQGATGSNPYPSTGDPRMQPYRQPLYVGDSRNAGPRANNQPSRPMYPPTGAGRPPESNYSNSPGYTPSGGYPDTGNYPRTRGYPSTGEGRGVPAPRAVETWSQPNYQGPPAYQGPTSNYQGAQSNYQGQPAGGDYRTAQRDSRYDAGASYQPLAPNGVSPVYPPAGATQFDGRINSPYASATYAR